ncbi:MAG TPA: dihydropteroate synthase [Longimicrobiales bacterium]
MIHAPASRPEWCTARGRLSLDRPVLVGILNVTPDSFSDGGRHDRVEAAVTHAERLLSEGAAIIDIGGESTRPGAHEVAAGDEAERVIPVIRAVVKNSPDAVISVDTTKADVARRALDAGAAIINDVSAFRLDPALADVVAEHGAGVILMHSRGTVSTMASYTHAQYDSVMREVCEELGAAAGKANAAGIRNDAIVLDPGLGFSKRTEDSFEVLAHLEALVALGFPVLVGPSRKRFTGDAAGGLPVEDRLEGTVAACCAALERGARLFRVHDVAAVKRGLAVAEAVRNAGRESWRTS